LGFFIDFAYGP